MYLFSMPGKEATSLVSCARYTKNILVAIIYLTPIIIIKIILNESAKKLWVWL